MNSHTLLATATGLGLVVAGFHLPANAQALEGTLKKISETKTITIGHRDSSIPFSYLDDKQQPIGYSMDLCMKVVDAVKTKLKMPDLQVKLNPVTSATRIPLMANGTIDLECGSTTNTAERQKQVAYAPTTFVTANRFVAKKASNVKVLVDLKGKPVVSTAGTTNLRGITGLNGEKNLGMNIAVAKDHAESFLMVETGRSTAFFMDDILLASLVASSKAPNDYMIGAEAYSVEPYAIMLRREDPQFKALVDEAIKAAMKSGDLDKLYKKWFQSPIPPKNINLNIPMGAELKKVVANPTDSPDPAMYSK